MRIFIVAVLAMAWLGQSVAAEDLLKPATTPPPIDDISAGNSSEAQATTQAEGVIRTIDVTENIVTIAHGPIPSLKLPAMVLPFKASANQLEGLAVGDAVTFEFTGEETEARLVSISKE